MFDFLRKLLFKYFPINDVKLNIKFEEVIEDQLNNLIDEIYYQYPHNFSERNNVIEFLSDQLYKMNDKHKKTRKLSSLKVRPKPPETKPQAKRLVVRKLNFKGMEEEGAVDDNKKDRSM